jgi:SLOG in TRPM, prokaryote
MGGIARAAFNTGAVLIDSGIGSGLEKFCIRKGLKLVGVCPGSQISYPKLSDLHRKPNELTTGHTHLIILGKDDK